MGSCAPKVSVCRGAGSQVALSMEGYKQPIQIGGLDYIGVVGGREDQGQGRRCFDRGRGLTSISARVVDCWSCDF